MVHSDLYFQPICRDALYTTFQLTSCIAPLPGDSVKNIHSPVEAMNKCRDYVDPNWTHVFDFQKDHCVYWIYNPSTSECYLSKSVPNSRTPTPPEGSPDYRIMGGIC